MRARLATSAEWREVVTATLDSMGVAGWELDLTTGAVWWSDNLGPMVGRPAGYSPVDYTDAEITFEIEGGARTFEQVLEFFASHDRGESERRAVLPDGRTRWTRHQYSVVRDDAGRPAYVFGIVTDIEETRRRTEEELFLGEASRILGRSLDIDETLASVASLMVPGLADYCTVDLLVDGELEPAVVAHADPSKVSIARAMREEYPPDMSASSGVGDVVRTGVSALHREISDEMVARFAGGDARRMELLRALGLRSALIVPLQSPKETLGALTLVHAESGRRFDDHARTFAEQVARRMGVAIDNARVHAELGMVAGQLSRLQAATSQLSRAIGEQEVAALAVTAGMEAGGADRGFLLVVDASARIAHSEGFGHLDHEPWTAAGGMAATALRSREPIFVESSAELSERFPMTAPSAPGGAWACLPIHCDGTDAVLVLVYDRPRLFGKGERASLVALGEQAGVALDRARLLTRHRTTAHTLQRGLMPPSLPEIDGIASSSVYEPSGAAEAGGDWYDLFPLSDGGVAAMVGDTVGHGVPAVATMARIRHVLAGHLHDGQGPAEALQAANRSVVHLVEERHRFATVAVACLDASRRGLRIAVAGHPSPVLLSGGRATFVDHPRGPALGFDVASTWSEATFEVGPETLLLLYTDGWIDHPGSDYEAQSQAIRTLVERTPPRPDVLLDAMRHRFADRPDRDDAAALAISIL